jgi:hypothetical protein
VNGAESISHDVTSGISHGSVLGPILFVIYINDMPDHVDSEAYLFADDTKVYCLYGDQTAAAYSRCGLTSA